MTRYRAEIYDPSFNFISFGAVASKDIKIDYLVEDTSSVEISAIILAHVNDYIAIREEGQIYFYGIVSNVSYDKNKTKISFVHFMHCLSVDVMEDVSVFETKSAEEWLHDRLLDLYAGSDTEQNIYGFSCTYNSETMIEYLSEASEPGQMESINLFNFVQMLLQKYEIMLTFAVNFKQKTVALTIDTIDTSDVWTMKLGLADTPDYDIDIHSIEGSFNKIKYYDTEDITNTVTYYLHSDGTVDTDGSTDRLTPVTYTEKTATQDTTEGQEKTFEEVALLDAETSMLNTDFNHEIIVTFNTESKLMPVGGLGQLYNLVTPEGIVYNTILTGFEQVNVKYVKMVFGYVRTSLTTILKMQRRR